MCLELPVIRRVAIHPATSDNVNVVTGIAPPGLAVSLTNNSHGRTVRVIGDISSRLVSGYPSSCRILSRNDVDEDTVNAPLILSSNPTVPVANLNGDVLRCGVRRGGNPHTRRDGQDDRDNQSPRPVLVLHLTPSVEQGRLVRTIR